MTNRDYEILDAIRGRLQIVWDNQSLGSTFTDEERKEIDGIIYKLELLLTNSKKRSGKK